MYINEEKNREIKKEKNKKTASETALKYLEHRDRTCMEVRRELEKKGFCKDEIEEAIKHLEEMGYLNDKSYGERYAKLLAEKGKGIIKIKNELYLKGIPSDIIEEVLGSEGMFDRQEERKRALKQAEKILGNIHQPFMENEIEDDTNYDEYEAKKERFIFQRKTKEKIARRLTSMGYSHETVIWVINSLYTN